MATGVTSSSVSIPFSSLTGSPKTEAFTRLSQPPYELHHCVYKGDLSAVTRLVEEAQDLVNVQDCHGTCC